jgi:DNA-binding transcriptional regulator YiaG
VDRSATLGVGRPALAEVLESAARLQQVVPDMVLVRGSAVALLADHRDSHDHDHVLADLSDRFDAVLEAVESTGGWVTNQVTPGKVILGELGGIESGVRQMIRRRPLEAVEVELPSGLRLRVPTPDETLRIRGYLILRRNRNRDYLDMAALSDRYGIEHAGAVLANLDDYYADQRPSRAAGVASQLARQLGDPRPRDPRTTVQLSRYKRLASRWHDWGAVVSVCQQVGLAMLNPARKRPVSTELRFRNLDASADDPPEQWPFEGFVTAIERGTMPDWRRIAGAVYADPWGPVATQVAEALQVGRPYGTTKLFEMVLEDSKRRAEASEKEEVAREIIELLGRSGLSGREFAHAIGTSPSRLSTYLSHRVTPSAALLVRMRRVAGRAAAKR